MIAAGAQDVSERPPQQGRPADGGRRLLLITYHFPPSREVGSLRWGQFAKLAAEGGWSLDVITLDPAWLPAADGPSPQLPAGVRVHGIPDPPLLLDRLVRALLAIRRRLLAARSNEAPPASPSASASARPSSLGVEELRSPFHSWRDAVRAFHAWRADVRFHTWSRRAAAVARRLLRASRYRAVVTCGPPHVVHVAGVDLRRRMGIPLIVDMRDPWSLAPRMQEEIASPLALAIARRRERRTVEAAALVVANTEPSRRAMQAAYPGARDKIIAILNGYDDEPVPPSEHDACFIIGYAGSIYLDRDPRPLFRAVACAVRDLALRPERLRLEFMGLNAIQAARLEQVAREEGTAGFVRFHPPHSRSEAQRFLARAAMLVSLPLVSLSLERDTSIPAKLFEYARFEAWLLALANPGSATADALRGTGADVVPPHDAEAIAAVIKRRYSAYASGARPERTRLPAHFSRRAQARLLFEEIERRLPVAQDPES